MDIGNNAIVSDLSLSIIVCAIIGILIFMVRTRGTEKPKLIQRLYYMVSVLFLFWLCGLVAIRFTDPANLKLLYVWDSLMYIGGAFLAVFALLIALTFVRGWEKVPRVCGLLCIIPTITVIMAWTNPLHHLLYRQFSLINSQMEFGPYIYVNGVYSYLCLVAATAIMVHFAVKNRNRLYTIQVLLLSLGNIAPLIVNSLGIFEVTEMSIVATPMSFVVTILLTGIAIYKLHLLDIKPVGIQHVLNWISDCYVILSDSGLVISYNKPFQEVFGGRYGIKERVNLNDCVKEEDIEHKTPIYNLLMSMQSCRETGSIVSYEQAVGREINGEYVKQYYIVDITPLTISEKLSGFVVLFKDVTQIKRSMQQLQDGQSRMIEQERLAFLGQMAGGLAHNLKTPIMSISGCTAAVENLIEECESSLGDEEVTPEDFREIYGEMREWLERSMDACAYMSEIISAIKGQAANVTTSATIAFSLDELIKRSSLLVRHELLSSKCRLETESRLEQDAFLQGDINNLIQVLNNLLSNAIYAQNEKGGGEITVVADRTDTDLRVYVKDTGPGLDPRVRQRLFKEMTTNKGAGGTGLGLYISNAVIRGKFSGRMWAEDNPGGGAVMGFSIPLENVVFKPRGLSEAEMAGGTDK